MTIITLDQCGTNQNRLSQWQKLFYGVGHVFNDLCANCWFSYVLIYMTKVVGFSETKAGLILLIGQVADALATLFIGYNCDRTVCKFYGKRKLWHAIGTLCVVLSFPFIFNLCISCHHSSELVKICYYSAFVVIFQFGWASTQISHLSLIPDICFKKSEKVELNAIRSGLTFVCGIFVYGVTWLLLGSNAENEVNTSTSKQFMQLSLIIIGVGMTCSLTFHIGANEKKELSSIIKDGQCMAGDGECDNECVNDVIKDKKMKNVALINDRPQKCWKDWLKDVKFYQTGILYMCTRLTMNIFQSFFVLFLTDSLHFNKEAIAYFPLLVLISGVVTSSCVKYVTKRIGSQITYTIGATFVIAASIWLLLVTKENRNSVYGTAWLAGSGISFILVTSLAKTADLIGKDKDSGAFVYSCMSFTDKLSTGLVVFIIQALKPASKIGFICSDCELFSKIVQTCLPASFALLGALVVIFFFPSEFRCIIRCIRKENTNDVAVQTISVIIEEPIESITEGIDENTNLNDFDHKKALISLSSNEASAVGLRMACPQMSPMFRTKNNI